MALRSGEEGEESQNRTKKEILTFEKAQFQELVLERELVFLCISKDITDLEDQEPKL